MSRHARAKTAGSSRCGSHPRRDIALERGAVCALSSAVRRGLKPTGHKIVVRRERPRSSRVGRILGARGVRGRRVRSHRSEPPCDSRAVGAPAQRIAPAWRAAPSGLVRRCALDCPHARCAARPRGSAALAAVGPVCRVMLEDAVDVAARLAEGGHAAVAHDRAGTGVVARHGEHQVTLPLVGEDA
jgi:hypothetical protein